ncbi:hypothetical protein ACA910_000137 [Epithemia clementina (nom. ined.)]
MLLINGLDAVKLRHGHYWQERGGGTAGSVRRFLAEVSRIMNTEILSTEDFPQQWECPTTKGNEQIGTLTMSNGRIRRVISLLDKMVDACVFDEERKTDWKRCINNEYRPMLRLLTSHRNLSDDEITSFQLLADRFFASWIGMHGLDGITNYIHMVGAGHFAEFLQHWGNLYQHSQQGWEAFNNLIKVFYYCRTQRGGAAGKSGKNPDYFRLHYGCKDEWFGWLAAGLLQR